MAEPDGAGNLQATNTFGAEGLVSRHTAATNSSVFYTFNERGNVAHLNKKAAGPHSEVRRLPSCPSLVFSCRRGDSNPHEVAPKGF